MKNIKNAKEIKIFNDGEYIGSVFPDKKSDLDDRSQAAKSINGADMQRVTTFMLDRVRDNADVNPNFKSVKDKLSFTVVE
ncbi:hypothetical protein ACQW5G_04015 [Fructilactobacillus sp. Tb1]|uniref:hypothetical protein n=1 Tax=Fructilactobacillus sp. Tb1 TaxID=3422304 RepID=UPI003D288896